MSVPRVRNTRLMVYGFTVPENMIMAIILAKANNAACKPRSRKIETVIAKLSLVYAYNFKHSATLLAAIHK